MIVSFGWTTPPLLHGVKTVTRREWTDEYAAKFREGMTLDAWNTSPRNVRANPHKVATIRLTAPVLRQPAREAPESDYEAEGLAWMAERGMKVDGLRAEVFWRAWGISNPLLYVVRFEVVEYLEGPLCSS